MYGLFLMFIRIRERQVKSLTWPASMQIRKEFNSQRIGLGHQHGCRDVCERFSKICLPVLYQVICMVGGREDPGVEFKVRLISRSSRECTCRWCNNHCLVPFASTYNFILGDPGATSRDDRIVIGNQWNSAPGMERLRSKNPFRRQISSVSKEGTWLYNK